MGFTRRKLELPPSEGKGLISIAWSGMTKIKAVNNKFEFEFAPSENVFWFNSIIKSMPPLFVPKGFLNQ